MPPATRAALVAALAVQPWAFALGAPLWVLALMVPDGDQPRAGAGPVRAGSGARAIPPGHAAPAA